MPDRLFIGGSSVWGPVWFGGSPPCLAKKGPWAKESIRSLADPARRPTSNPPNQVPSHSSCCTVECDSHTKGKEVGLAKCFWTPTGSWTNLRGEQLHSLRAQCKQTREDSRSKGAIARRRQRGTQPSAGPIDAGDPVRLDWPRGHVPSTVGRAEGSTVVQMPISTAFPCVLGNVPVSAQRHRFTVGLVQEKQCFRSQPRAGSQIHTEAAF